MSRYMLIPVEDDTAASIPVDLPDGIVCDEVYQSIKRKVKDIERLNWLIGKLTHNRITESPTGLIMWNGTQMKLNFRDVIIDTCNNIFKREYEDFYKLLRGFDISL